MVENRKKLPCWPPKNRWFRVASILNIILKVTVICFPQQRKLRGSSAQNSSGVHWCRRRVRFNEVPEKLPEKVWETGFQRRFWRRFQRRSGRLWCRAKSGSKGFRRRFREALVQSQVRFNMFGEGCRSQGQVHLIHGKSAEVFPALGFPARFRKICKNKTLRPLQIPPKLIHSFDTIYHGEYQSATIYQRFVRLQRLPIRPNNVRPSDSEKVIGAELEATGLGASANNAEYHTWQWRSSFIWLVHNVNNDSS